MAYIDDYQQNLTELKEAQEERIKSNIEAQKQEAKTLYDEQQAKITPQYQTARTETSVASQKQAKNLAEYLANRGLASSGAGVQTQISTQGALQKNLTDLRSEEASAISDLASERTSTLNTLATEEQDKYAEVENTYLANILQKFDDENTYQRELEQYNQEMEYQKQQDILAQQVAQQQFEYQKQQDAISNSLAQQQLNYNYSTGWDSNPIDSSSDGIQIQTDYYSGSINPDALRENGTFNTADVNGVKYQPNNVAGNKLDKTGKTVSDVFGTGNVGLTGASVDNQNIWTTNGRYYIWDGSQNQYIDVTDRV